MPTYTTIPFLLLLALMWRWTRGNTLAIVAFTSIFDAASVLNIGALGIAPWLMALAIGLPVQLFQGRLCAQVAPGTLNRLGFYFLLAFFICAAISGVALPVVFEGVPVLQLMVQVPLHWGLPNLAQLCYLTAAFAVFFLTLTSTPEQISQTLRWYVRGAITSAFIGFYQLACALTHMPFPTAVLHSNTAHVVYDAYQINGMWRLNSTFTEASEMAGALVPALAILCWDWAMKPHSWKRTASLALLFTSMMMTLSTTGYLCVAVLLACAVPVWFWQFVMCKRFESSKLAIILISLLVSLTVAAADGSVRQASKKLVDSVLLNKTDTDSYRARTQTHFDALETLENTAFLGAGWGSTRASGLFYTLLAAVGIPGTALFALACAGTLFPILMGARSALPDFSAGCITLAFLMILLAMFIAGAEPVAPALWILIGAALRVAKPPRQAPVQLLPAPDRHGLSSAIVPYVIPR